MIPSEISACGDYTRRTRLRLRPSKSEMASEIKKRIELEIVHVLFLDIVGYSKRRTNEQHALIDQLNQVVRSSDQFRRAEAAGRLIRILTGDNLALVFSLTTDDTDHTDGKEDQGDGGESLPLLPSVLSMP